MSEKLSISYRALLLLTEGLNSLDAVKSGKDEIVSFEFSPAVSIALAQNFVLCDQKKQAFDRAIRQQSKQNKIIPGESIKLDASLTDGRRDQWQTFTDAIEDLKDTEVEINGLVFIRLDDLLNRPKDADGRVKSNPIPQSVRNKLVPILKFE